MMTDFKPTAVLGPPSKAQAREHVRATDVIFDSPVDRKSGKTCWIGVLEGEGIGVEVTAAALRVLRELAATSGAAFQVEKGGMIGLPAEESSGSCLPAEAIDFCRSIFDRGGAVLAGAGGGRFVYDVRRCFDLFIKLNPIVHWPELADVSVLKEDAVRGADVMVVRENIGGLYHGQTREVASGPGRRVLEHTFRHAEAETRRFLTAAARLARQRRGSLTVVHKTGGVPGLAALWREVAEDVAHLEDVEFRFLDIDFACYLMLREPRQFDVIAAPNCFADILSDLGGVIMGGRGLTFGGSFGSQGTAVYQTNHGAAYDLRGTDRGNPLGHILAMAMMLRESFGLVQESMRIESAVRRVAADGFRTDDIAATRSTRIGLMEMADRVADALATD